MNMKECTAAEFAKFVYDPSNNFNLDDFGQEGCVAFDEKLRILALACIDIRKKFPGHLVSYKGIDRKGHGVLLIENGSSKYDC